MMNKSESIKELSAALAKAQAEISNPKKNASNPYFKSKYSDLSEVINVSKPILSAHGLSVVQMPSYNESHVFVETMLLHESGEYLSSEMSMPLQKIDAQSIGSVITYIRRYSLAAVCGLAQQDDDGEAAVGRSPEQKKPTIKKITISQETKNQVNECIEKSDAVGFKQLWHELSRPEQEELWKILSSKQQVVARDLLKENEKVA